ncbi:hypothetical protein CIG75_16740 [Tumebacillus algifaecis]|uniref:DUF2935 domain-containing protein n=1 Tax=Tumebacillus algifaecis TaxID=1214604 RepID=A0A223D4C9_9BACL|nr:DUF2935 domain-containing protein [Tumebacillus algifaecis]ASS76442.1 hypothetical protein CIG75_16740 [Tumebacillus algifaecis]
MPTHQQAALFEHRFWLQIMGDHARFILATLSSQEKREVERTLAFRSSFDQLLATSRHHLSDEELIVLAQQAAQLTHEFRQFKLHLVSRQLTGEIALTLPPTFLNHMVNELEEYSRILNHLLQGKEPPVFHAVHHHLLWLPDASGHADGLASYTDMSEKLVIARAKSFSAHFSDLYLKAIEMAGFLRTGLQEFPPLARLNKESELEILLFMEFLNELEQMELDHTLLSTLSPLMPDHMYREECYYLTKLGAVSNLCQPNCDPTRPRVQD